MSAKRNNCMFALPHELTGLGECCGLFGGELACNGYGKHCTGYKPHNAASRKAIADAIAEMKRKREGGENYA